jgi:hypothetical protein
MEFFMISQNISFFELCFPNSLRKYSIFPIHREIPTFWWKILYENLLNFVTYFSLS